MLATLIRNITTHLRPQHWDLWEGEPIGRYNGLFYVRTFLLEPHEDQPYLDQGPWDRPLAELVLADIGVDASFPLDGRRLTVTRAHLIHTDEAPMQPFTRIEITLLKFLAWRYTQPTFQS